ncbi:serine hydrolase domain-containing protein [Streptomyces sp. MST-110588]|uniref:serine hydrolase domain-containing protein n=1 Tax=Streptomyces sp. MST-110588 TaxID=2833628 RepID=UPI001F5C6E19|nr:serine hydrolase domain-containing protein [Streptomyces sp. MST-110588]UNO42472.1 beta-lactamase family protein [Streptomyces sp. MST-110588]
MTSTTPSRLSRRAALGTALAGALLLTSALPATAATPAATARSSSNSHPTGSHPHPLPPLDTDALRAAISDLNHPQVTGAQVRVDGTAGRWQGTAGVADIKTGRPIGPNDKFRIGSITKVFVATVVLQLSAEHRVDLNAPIQRYLPGLLPDRFPPITITQLLNHTSGLPDESGPDIPDTSTPEKVLQHRYDQWTPERIVATVTRAKKMKFTPGSKQEYRGINYVLAAMLIEKVTGHSYGKEIATRILRPLHLNNTSVPGNDPKIHGPHVHGYLAMTDGTLKDATDFNQTVAWGEGEMISTTRDLDRFISALFTPGKLLPPATLNQMFTLPAKHVHMLDGSPARYSTGLQTVTINGITVWGKTGERYGYYSAMVSTKDQQRRAIYSFNPTHRDATQTQLALRIANALTTPPAPTHS